MPGTYTQYMTAWTAAYITSPPGNTYAYGARLRLYVDSMTLAAGSAGDTIGLVVLPPYSTLVMLSSWFAFANFTSGATLSVGWAAYKDENGATQAASAAGLLNAVSLTADGAWTHGLLAISTPDDSNPVLTMKRFNNREPVDIYATIGTQAPTSNDTLAFGLAVLTP